jgi:membrane carboxypeptidase/penicillin-binding protein
VESELREVPSLCLGTSEVNLLEITSAYAGVANGGEPHHPHLVSGILDAEGREVDLKSFEDPPGVGRQEAFLATRLLEGVIRSGSGERARELGVRGAVAGKTGTTDDYHDAWFVGFTPRRAIGVWVGFDRNQAVGLSGAAAALPIWAMTMRAAAGNNGDGPFTRPRGVVRYPVCRESGAIASPECPDILEEDFIEGTEPMADCGLHRQGVITRFRDWLGF